MTLDGDKTLAYSGKIVDYAKSGISVHVVNSILGQSWPAGDFSKYRWLRDVHVKMHDVG